MNYIEVLAEILKKARQEYLVELDKREDLGNTYIIRNLLRDLLEKVFKDYIEKIALTKKGWSINPKREDMPLFLNKKIVIQEIDRNTINNLLKLIPASDYERRRVFTNAERLILKYCYAIRDNL